MVSINKLERRCLQAGISREHQATVNVICYHSLCSYDKLGYDGNVYTDI